MSKRRITKITVESERFVVINRRRQPTARLCDDCHAQTQMVKPEEAAAIAAVTPRTIYRWVEAGKLHFTESPDGWLLVCLNSLPRDQA